MFSNARDKAHFPLARISHQASTATAHWHTLPGFPSVGLLSVVSTTPARPSVGKASHTAPLSRLATNPGEKCGLARLLCSVSTPHRSPTHHSFLRREVNLVDHSTLSQVENVHHNRRDVLRQYVITWILSRLKIQL